MRSILLNITVACVALCAAFSYSGYYCLNSGEPDIAEGLLLTFAIPFALAAFVALAGFAATPQEREL
jgi:drug/metabolite transporter (DMT)-like permease